MPFIRPGRDLPVSITVLGTGMIADNQWDGVEVRTLTLTGVSVACLLLASVGILTASFAGPPTLNNGNTLALEYNQDFGPEFPTFSNRAYSEVSAAGGSDHAITVDKDATFAGELTLMGIALSGGAIQDSSVTSLVAGGAGHTHTSNTVTTAVPALLVSFSSGAGDVNPTNPTQTYPAGWTVHQFVARNSSEAPSGHIQTYMATKWVDAGTHSVAIQVTIDEGIIIALFAVG